VAWTSGVGCAPPPGGCALHLSDLRTGTDRVAEIGGADGFAPLVGAFSPNGTRLAAFAVPATGSAGHLDVALVSTGDGDAVTVGSVSAPAGRAPALGWSATGEFVVFGTGGPLNAVEVVPGGDAPATIPLNIDAGCCIVGF
jgi:hypothetical protein